MQTLMENHIEKEEMAPKIPIDERETYMKRWIHVSLGVVRQFYDWKFLTVKQYNEFSDMVCGWLKQLDDNRDVCNQCD